MKSIQKMPEILSPVERNSCQRQDSMKLRNVLSWREDWIKQRKLWGQGCPNDPVVDRGIWSIEERKNILVKAVNCGQNGC